MSGNPTESFVVHDFLLGRSTQVVLFRIVLDAGMVGVVVGLFPERVYGVGRKAAAEFDVLAESLVRVGSVAGGVVRWRGECCVSWKRTGFRACSRSRNLGVLKILFYENME